MNIEDFMFMEHSDYKNLKPLKELNNKKLEQVIINFGLDINDFYKVEGKIYPYCYSNRTVLVEIYEISEKYFKDFQIKKVIEQREKAHKECIENKNYGSLFVLIDKPFRFEWFEKLYYDIPEEQRYEIFNFIYTTSEYGFNSLSKDLLRNIYKHNDKEKKLFSDDIIFIYRGEGSKSTPYTRAYSWTINLKIAKKFANRFDNNGKIYKGKIKQNDILDVFYDRGENEVIVFPENVFDIEEI